MVTFIVSSGQDNQISIPCMIWYGAYGIHVTICLTDILNDT